MVDQQLLFHVYHNVSHTEITVIVEDLTVTLLINSVTVKYEVLQSQNRPGDVVQWFTPLTANL